MRNRRRWGFKGGPKTHEVLKWSELSVNHLQDLKDDVRPLKQGESLVNVLQQDDVNVGAANWNTGVMETPQDFLLSPSSRKWRGELLRAKGRLQGALI